MAIVKRERTTLSPPKAVPMSRPIPLANAGIEVPPVIADDVIRLVSMMFMIVLNCFFFLPAACVPLFHQEKMLQFQLIFLINMFVVFLVL